MSKPQNQAKVEPRLVHLNVPTSTHYITFPLDLSRHITITWSEDGRNKYGHYHYGTCYFGNLVDEHDLPVEEKFRPEESVGMDLSGSRPAQYFAESNWPQPKILAANGQRRLKICGESVIFVASEFLETDTLGGPLDRYHFKSAHNQVNTDGRPWVTVQLNPCFEYGQKNGTFTHLERFIVYHPRIYSWMMPRMMFQHRFMTALESDALREGGQQPAVQVSASAPSFTGRIFGTATKVAEKQLKIGVGHTLHQFLNDADVYMAEEIAGKIKKPIDAYFNYEKKMLRKAEDEDAAILRHEAESMRITALQIVEQAHEKAEKESGPWLAKDREKLKLIEKLASGPGVLVTMANPPKLPMLPRKDAIPPREEPSSVSVHSPSEQKNSEKTRSLTVAAATAAEPEQKDLRKTRSVTMAGAIGANALERNVR